MKNSEPCHVCHSSLSLAGEAEDHVTGKTFSIQRCANCGVGITFPRPTSEEMGQYYPASYYGEEQKKFIPLIELVSRTIRKVLMNSIRHLMRGPGVLLEVGCGRGDLLTEFSRIGWECHGTEYSSSPIMGNERTFTWNLHNVQSLRDAHFSSESFDIVIIRHVLEHLAEPGEVLQEIARILKPGGCLYLVVPNFGGIVSRWFKTSWFALDVPRHLYHFTPECLALLLEKSGLKIIRQSSLSFEQDVFTFAQSAQNSLGLPFNGFYDLIRNTSAQLGRKPALSGMTKVSVLISGAVLSIVGFFVSLFSAMGNRGGVIEIIAKKDSPAA